MGGVFDENGINSLRLRAFGLAVFLHGVLLAVSVEFLAPVNVPEISRQNISVYLDRAVIELDIAEFKEGKSEPLSELIQPLDETSENRKLSQLADSQSEEVVSDVNAETNINADLNKTQQSEPSISGLISLRDLKDQIEDMERERADKLSKQINIAKVRKGSYGEKLIDPNLKTVSAWRILDKIRFVGSVLEIVEINGTQYCVPDGSYHLLYRCGDIDYTNALLEKDGSIKNSSRRD